MSRQAADEVARTRTTQQAGPRQESVEVPSQENTGSQRVGPLRRARILLIAIIYSGLWAVMCDFILEMSVWLGWIRNEAPWYDVFTSGKGIWLGSFVVWLCLVALVALTNRYWLSLGAMLAATLAVASANLMKLEVRHEPIYPSDVDFLGSPRFLFDMVTPVQLALALLIGTAVVTLSVWVGRRLDEAFPRLRRTDSARQWWTVLAVRILVVLVTATLLVSATRFNEPGSRWRAVYESQGANWKFWYQARNYRDNGFVGGFFYNMPVAAMAEPDGYSKAAMDRIAERYALLARETNRDRAAGALDDVNVVLLLNEAFTDPMTLRGFSLGEDPFARSRSTMAGTTSGTMLAQMYGAGTANMEFEALTGQSLALFRPQMNAPYQMLLPDITDYPSAVSWFKARGHRPLAVHPYLAAMYKRGEAYASLGFDEFVSDTTMRHDDRLQQSRFISDESAFDEVLYQLDRNERPVLLNLVTMQNHVPMSKAYDDPVQVKGVDGDDAKLIGSYARGLKYTDAALADFLTSLTRSPEKTIVVVYGDHQPGVYEEDVVEQNPGLAMYQTPFFIWSSEGNSPRTLPTTSPIHFLPLIFESLGARVPPYYAMLDELRKHVPAMEQGRFVTPDGSELTESELSKEAQRVLHDVRLVQYDFSIGQRYALDAMWGTTD